MFVRSQQPPGVDRGRSGGSRDKVITMIIEDGSKERDRFIFAEYVQSCVNGKWATIFCERVMQLPLDNGSYKYTTKDGREWISYGDG